MTLPSDYIERVYAGVLGKMIAVHLGGPIEGWSYEMIMKRFGEINYYVHEALDLPLIVIDDDLSGTFTFVRALPDYGNSQDLTAQQIGQTWLNYIVEGKPALWWGGIGDVSEHTAYLRLKNGIQPPRSGSIELNGPVMAEQIGAQIFIDGWGMIAPGDPELAASVSHDGEAIYGAQGVAALIAGAFVESDMDRLIDASVVYHSARPAAGCIRSARAWRERDRQIPPVNRILAHGMPPICEAKTGAPRVVLVKEMVVSAPVDHAVGVVHPAGRRDKMIDGPVEIRRQAAAQRPNSRRPLTARAGLSRCPPSSSSAASMPTYHRRSCPPGSSQPKSGCHPCPPYRPQPDRSARSPRH